MFSVFYQIIFNYRAMFLSLCLLTSLHALAQKNLPSIKTIPARAGQESSHDYFVSLLRLALSHTATNNQPETISFSKAYNQNGYLLELMRGSSNLDVLWSGSSRSREKNLLTVRIPLVKGLLGYRMPIIRQQDQGKFSAINSLQQLQKFTACQGMYWPDVDILEANNITVKRLKTNEEMFSELKKGNCDYISLAVFEGQAELNLRRETYPGLIFFQQLIIYYPYPMYFFVQKSKPELHTRIEQGLKYSIDDGSFERLMREHESTRFIFPLSEWKNATTIQLDNVSLNLNSKNLSPELWILP